MPDVKDSCTTRRCILNVLAAMVLALCLPPAEAGADSRGDLLRAEHADLYLLMVDDPNCQYCRRWDREVGVVYERSPEGRMAPLVRRRMDHPDVRAFRNVAYTPTFILVHGGREIGRIVGYPGAAFFWEMLDDLLRKAGANDPSAPRKPGQQTNNT